jgi:hypothetical protein
MAELKTKPTDESVTGFLNAVEDETRREDCYALLELMREVTHAQPEMWGTSIVGFGRFRYHYASGRTGEWMLVGFAPRKRDLTLYLMPNLDDAAELMGRLGKYKMGKSCLYIKRLADVDLAVLREVVRVSVDKLAAQRLDA